MTKPRAYIFDLDNTLVDSSHRNWDDLSKVMDDSLIFATAHLIEMLDPQFHIFIVTARSVDHGCATSAWLEANDVLYDGLYMRPRHDSSTDAEVKEKIFNEISENYEVLGVFDNDPEAYKGLGVTRFIVGA